MSDAPVSRGTEGGRRLKVIGQNLRKVDATAKVTGRTLFADDLFFPEMLHARIHRARIPHAKVISVDVTRAAAMPGVVAVLTGAALPVKFGILPVSQDEHALAVDRVRYVGDPVAAVAAVDEATAEAACEAITVRYEPLPAFLSIEEALAHPEVRIHDDAEDGNIHKKIHLQFGDLEAGFGEADEVQEDLFFYQGNTHLPMEQHASVAQWDPDGKLTLYSSTQTPHYLHRALAKVLGLAPPKIRVIATPNGGGFGGKSDPFSHEIIVSKFAMMTGKPVKTCLTREEVFYTHRGRHPVLMSLRTGFKRDGAITAMHLKTFLDGGAHGSYGVASTYYTGALQTVTYKVPHYRFEGVRVFTNKPPCGPKRGHGTPQPRFGLEIQMDKIAERIGMDPAELRLKYLQPAESLTANWMRIRTMGLDACLRKVVEASDWKNRFRKMPRGRGLGLACSSYITGAGLSIYWNELPQSGVQLKLDRSGGVTVFCGSTDIGQGSDSILAYVVAEVLGIEPLGIRVVTSDTDLTPVDLGSYSSRVTIMSGNAALQAAERARELLSDAASAKLAVPKGRLVFAGGRVFDAEDPTKGLSFAEAVVTAETKFGTLGTTGSYRPKEAAARYKGGGVGPTPTYSYTACVVDLSADPETGILNVHKVWIAHDIGQAINRMAAIGQLEGGVYMGLGEALMEEQVFRNGVHKWPSMLEYKSPTTMEMPEIECFLIEDPDPEGPFGAKEIGQGPLLPVMPAVCNALYDALRVRVDEVPVTPEKVMAALKNLAAGKPGRFGPTRFPTVPMPEPTVVPTPYQGGDGKAREGTERRKTEGREALRGGNRG